MLQSEVKTSTMCLAGIGLADLVITVLLLRMGMAEGNPLFGRLLIFGPWAFVLGKVLFLAGPILILEYARRTHPESAEQATWIAFVAYAFLLCLQFIRIGS